MSSPGAPSPEEPLHYRPLSGLAIAGLAISGVYALIVLFTGFRAFVQGDPLILESYWLILPLLGVVLSAFARVQIRNSEGTRAGMGLARWGLGLGIIFGLGYFVYSLGTSLAIRHQANQFIMEPGDESGFLSRLKHSSSNRTDFNAAFLLTVPPANRGKVRPENDEDVRASFGRAEPDGGPSLLTRFQEHQVVLLFHSGDENAIQVEPLGVREWTYSKQGFRVRRIYRVTTEEVVAEVLLTVQSTEGGAGETRRWQVVLKESGQTPDSQRVLTSTGKAVEKLRLQIASYIMQWLDAMNKGQAWAAFVERDATNWEQLLPQHSLRTNLKDAITKSFTGTEPKRVQLKPSFDSATWKRDRGKLVFQVPYQLMVLDPVEKSPVILNGFLSVSSQEAVGDIQANLEPTWEVTRLEFTGVQPKSTKGP